MKIVDKYIPIAIRSVADDCFLKGESILLSMDGEFEYFRIIQGFIAGEILRQLEETSEVRRAGSGA